MRDSDMHGSGEVADRGSFPGKTKSMHMHVQLKSSRPRSARAGIRATCVRQKPLIMGSLLACTPPRFAGWLAGLSRAQCSAGGRDSPGTVELPPTTSRCSPGRNPHHHHATARGARPIHHPHPAFPFGIRPDHHVAVAGDGVRPRRRWARLRGTPPVILQMGRHARLPSSPTLGLLVPRR
jgi:hypothetical protein